MSLSFIKSLKKQNNTRAGLISLCSFDNNYILQPLKIPG